MSRTKDILEKMIKTKYDRDYTDLLKKVAKGTFWDKPPEVWTEGATRYVMGTIKGQEYWVLVTPPNSSYSGGWVFDDVSVGDPYLGKKMFKSSGDALSSVMATGTGRPIDWIRAYQKSDDLIKKNLQEFTKALNYLKKL